MMSLAPALPDLALYIHWPFCARKCPYCDFNSHVRPQIDHDAWAQAYETEIAHYAQLLEDHDAKRPLASLFFGGGTPSLMQPFVAERAIAAAQRHFGFRNDIEITLEANPTSVEADHFADLAAAGVNRISLGVQSLHDADLQFLGRTHSAAEAQRALALARTQFDRVSCDLIYARPEQRPEDWQAELETALAFDLDHLSLYQLTIEPKTVFELDYARGAFTLPDEPQAAALYEMTRTILAEAGLPGYEISNYARTGEESRHNLIYWRYQDYIGIGPGAHGRLSLGGAKYASRAHRAPEIYLRHVSNYHHGRPRPLQALTPDERGQECLMMGLRLTEGLPLARLQAETGAEPDHWLCPTACKYLEEEGLLTQTPTHLTATESGLQRLDAVLSYLLVQKPEA